jgi:hypothetical protein
MDEKDGGPGNGCEQHRGDDGVGDGGSEDHVA